MIALLNESKIDEWEVHFLKQADVTEWVNYTLRDEIGLRGIDACQELTLLLKQIPQLRSDIILICMNALNEMSCIVHSLIKSIIWFDK